MDSRHAAGTGEVGQQRTQSLLADDAGAVFHFVYGYFRVQLSEQQANQLEP